MTRDDVTSFDSWLATRDDVIYFIEQRFDCKLGRPFEHADREKLQSYVTLDGNAPSEHHRACQLINAFGHIADLMGWQRQTKPVLWWRLKTKVDDSEQMGIMRTRVYIENCPHYGARRNDHWRRDVPIPVLVYSRPVTMLLELKGAPKGVVVPVLDPGVA